MSRILLHLSIAAALAGKSAPVIVDDGFDDLLMQGDPIRPREGLLPPQSRPPIEDNSRLSRQRRRAMAREAQKRQKRS